MTDQEMLARAALRDLESVGFKELLGLRERNPGSVEVWKSRNGSAIGFVQLRLRPSWWSRLVQLSAHGVPNWPWAEQIHDTTMVHKIERLLAESGGPHELIRINIGAPGVIEEAWSAGFLKQVTR